MVSCRANKVRKAAEKAFLRDMNWEMLAAIGQLAAVFVGIPSLIYLATQIREQTKERRQSAVHASHGAVGGSDRVPARQR